MCSSPSSPSVFVLGGRGSESALVSPSPSSSSSSSVFVLGDGGGESALVVVSSSSSSSSSSSVFVLGDGGGESALVVVSSPSSVFVSGDGGDLELGVFVVVVVLVCFCFGGRRGRVSFGVVAVVLVVLVCFCFGGRRGRVSFGVVVVCFCFGGRWRFGVGCVRRRRLFLFWAGGGASQLWCRRRLFLFRGDGGESASGVRSNGLCPQRVLAAGGLVPVGFKHSWLSTSHYLLAKLCDGDSLRVRGTRAPARRRERG